MHIVIVAEWDEERGEPPQMSLNRVMQELGLKNTRVRCYTDDLWPEGEDVVLPAQ